jgi:hypothetical protein
MLRYPGNRNFAKSPGALPRREGRWASGAASSTSSRTVFASAATSAAFRASGASSVAFDARRTRLRKRTRRTFGRPLARSAAIALAVTLVWAFGRPAGLPALRPALRRRDTARGARRRRRAGSRALRTVHGPGARIGRDPSALVEPCRNERRGPLAAASSPARRGRTEGYSTRGHSCFEGAAFRARQGPSAPAGAPKLRVSPAHVEVLHQKMEILSRIDQRRGA